MISGSKVGGGAVRFEIKDGCAVAYPEGRISSANAAEVQRELTELADDSRVRELVVDAENLKYISSAGLRVLLALAKKRGGTLAVRNVSPEVYEIFEMTGFTSILDVRRRLREISVDGCEIVGRGEVGTVYRIDEDTIVKVYELPDSVPMIENEQKRAKQAFLKGIPTAISYDIVRVGEKYGSVFEMLKASTYNDVLRSAPERKAEIVRDYARFLRRLHGVAVEPGELPDVRDVYRGYLDVVRKLLPEALFDRLHALFSAMPEDLHVIHGDIHMKNIMLDGTEPLLIDMDALSAGDPVFDLQGVFVTYQLFGEDDPDNTQRFLGISQELADYVWEKTLEYYFDGLGASALEEEKNRIRIVAYVRFLYLLAEYGSDTEERNQRRIGHTLEHLQALAHRVDSLQIRPEVGRKKA